MRKAREKEVGGQSGAKVFYFHRGYDKLKPGKDQRVRDAVVLLHYEAGAHQNDEPLRTLSCWTKMASNLLLHETSSACKTFYIIDVLTLLDDSDSMLEVLDSEGGAANLDKKISKPLARMLNKMLLYNCTILAYRNACQLLMKMMPIVESNMNLHKLISENVQRIVLIDPLISIPCINAQLEGSNYTEFAQNVVVDLVFTSTKERDKRLKVLRSALPNGNDSILSAEGSISDIIMQYFYPGDTNDVSWYPGYVNNMGESLFAGELQIEMNKHSKQYEQIAIDMTDELYDSITRKEVVNNVVDSLTVNTPHPVLNSPAAGALILRGNRCVLARSLTGAWPGMRIPYVELDSSTNESLRDAAVRSIVQLCDIEEDEMYFIDTIPPIYVYQPNSNVYITVFIMYAHSAPDCETLDEYDMEDEESEYDWYTFQRAIDAFSMNNDVHAISAFKTLAFSLAAANMANQVPNPENWGGILGQEWMDEMVIKSSNAPCTAASHDHTHDHGHGHGHDHVIEIVDAVAINPLPVTVLSGFLGAGKTTLLQKLLLSNHGFRIALIVNDMADVNIDAALVQSTVSISKKEEKLIELTNGCICCTLREDLLTEVSKLALECKYDYLIIESSGISEPMPVAETFTFDGAIPNSAQPLSSIAKLDTMCTVVDGPSFLSNLYSIDKLINRGWEANELDTERTISHLLIDQIEFANVVVINKLDQMTAEEPELCKSIIRKLNPKCDILLTSYSDIDVTKIMNTNKFQLAEAEKNPEWLQTARIGEHVPESVEYGISSFTFRSYKPFHPIRLYELCQLIMIRSESSPLNCLVRAKGFAWLCNRPQQQGIFSLAGTMTSITAGAPWWSALDKSLWPAGLQEAIQPLWREPYGDRQNEIVFIGQHMDAEVVREIVNNALVTDEEFQLGQDLWFSMVEHDPYSHIWQDYEAELLQSHGHEHAHDHHH